MPELFASRQFKNRKKIVKLLDGCEKHTQRSEKKVNALQEVKKSLLQNLLTGKIRIPEGAVHG